MNQISETSMTISVNFKTFDNWKKTSFAVFDIESGYES